LKNREWKHVQTRTSFVWFNARAQTRDDQALLDALVRKGVLSEKEADEISAEAAQGAVTTSAARINIGSWVQELNIGGDIRNRVQWDQRTPMILTNALLGPQNPNIPRNRWRFRMPLGADFLLEDNFFGEFQVATGDNRRRTRKMRPTPAGTITILFIFPVRSWVEAGAWRNSHCR
jgi:hypothetical protein